MPHPGELQPAVTERAFALPVLLNGWTNYGQGYTDAGWRKDAMGVVWLRGLLKGGALGVPVFTLPARCQPSRTWNLAVHSNAALGIVEVRTNGDIVLTNGSNTYFSLDGLAIHAAA